MQYEVQFVTSTGETHAMRVKADSKTEAKEKVKKLASIQYHGDVKPKKATQV